MVQRTPTTSQQSPRLPFTSLNEVVTYYAALSASDPSRRQRRLTIEPLETPLHADSLRSLSLPDSYIDVAIRYTLHRHRIGHASLAPWMPSSTSLVDAIAECSASLPFDPRDCIAVASMDVHYVFVRKAATHHAGRVELVSGQSLEWLGTLCDSFADWLLAIATCDACARSVKARIRSEDASADAQREFTRSECQKHISQMISSERQSLWTRWLNESI